MEDVQLLGLVDVVPHGRSLVGTEGAARAAEGLLRRVFAQPVAVEHGDGLVPVLALGAEVRHDVCIPTFSAFSIIFSAFL